MTYLNQCLAECADAAPANGVQWEQGIPCEQDITEADAKCKLLDNKRVVRVNVVAFFSFEITSVATLPQSYLSPLHELIDSTATAPNLW